MMKLLMTICLIGTILLANLIDASPTLQPKNVEPEQSGNVEARYISNNPNVVDEIPTFPDYDPSKYGNFNDNNNTYNNNDNNKQDINDKASKYTVVYVDDMNESWLSNLRKVLVPVKNLGLSVAAHLFDITVKTLYFVIVGLLTSSIVCNLTPFCNIEFNGIGNSNKAIEKVQKLARSFIPGNGGVDELAKRVNEAGKTNKDPTATRAKRQSPYWMEELEKLATSVIE